MPWKKISSKKIYKNRWMEVTEDIVKNEFGDRLTFGVVHKKPFALIIPWDGKHLTLVGQYRYPVRFFSWEFPAGHFEHKTMGETAKKELEEEAGLKAKNIKKIAYYHLAPGHHTQGCHIFLATKLSKGKRELEVAETGMKVKKVTPKQMQKMIIDGTIKDGPTIVAFGMAVFKNLLKE
jgi:8-oxo-dGTP pyrophosphatase MutT (NUDIX family)